MYVISGMIFIFSIRDFGHPKCLKSQFEHPVMKILAKSLLVGRVLLDQIHVNTFWRRVEDSVTLKVFCWVMMTFMYSGTLIS